MKAGPRLYFSFRSPYSWLTLRRLQDEVPDLFERVELIPYWDPDSATDAALRARDAEFHYVQMSKAKHLYLLIDTKRLAQRLGMAMAWPIDVDAWWEVPHLAWLWARRQGEAAGFYRAITDARWLRGENICQPTVVAGLAEKLGLDAATASSTAEDPHLRAEAVDCLVRAYHDDVFGIPYLRVGRHRFWGYDRTELMIDALRGVAAPPESDERTATASIRSYDSDTTGGCG